MALARHHRLCVPRRHCCFAVRPRHRAPFPAVNSAAASLHLRTHSLRSPWLQCRTTTPATNPAEPPSLFPLLLPPRGTAEPLPSHAVELPLRSASTLQCPSASKPQPRTRLTLLSHSRAHKARTRAGNRVPPPAIAPPPPLPRGAPPPLILAPNRIPSELRGLSLVLPSPLTTAPKPPVSCRRGTDRRRPSAPVELHSPTLLRPR